jgi:hypothetical protein
VDDVLVNHVGPPGHRLAVQDGAVSDALMQDIVSHFVMYYLSLTGVITSCSLFVRECFSY